MGDSKIEWTDKTWSPIRARVKQDAHEIAILHGWDDLAEIVKKMAGHVGPHCEMCSPGCNHCYSLTNNGRCLPNNGTGLPFDKRSRELVDIFVDDNILMQPLRWKASKKNFVENQSDLFGEWVPREMIDRVFAAMLIAHHHTFQVLTKRADIMHDYLSDGNLAYRIGCELLLFSKPPMPKPPHIPQHLLPRLPLFNVWLGVSAEDQQRADERIPKLLQTPAAKRFVSYEPALGPIDFNLRGFLRRSHDRMNNGRFTGCESHFDGIGNLCVTESHWMPPLDWVIVGGESGPGARPFNIQWARDVVAQCEAAVVTCFVKQFGAKPYQSPDDGGLNIPQFLHSRKGGDMSEWAEDLRVRKFPGL